MQLKNGFHLMTSPPTNNIRRRRLPPLPNHHNNNQPFSNVNLAVSEVHIDIDGGEDDDNSSHGDDEDNAVVPVYSLYDEDDEGAAISNVGDQNGQEDQHEEDDNRVENLRFLTNEHGFLELLDDDEDDSSDDSDSSDDETVQETTATATTISCITCGCFGLESEFYDDKHCTYDCGVITRVNERLEGENRVVDEEDGLDGEESSSSSDGDSKKRRINDDGQGTGKKLKIADDQDGLQNENQFRPNDLLEAIDPLHQSLFCPVRVVEVLRNRLLLLRFIGYPDKYNFWVDCLTSHDIFPVGWTQNYNNHNNPTLHFSTPPNFTSWDDYVANNPNCRVAPEGNFKGVLEQGCDSSIKVGMKLEAVDIRSKSLLICVATVSCVLGGRLLVHFDSWDSVYDYWTCVGDGYLFPVGYCKGVGVEITPPCCYQTPSEFDWNEYLKKTGSIPMPSSLFASSTTTPQHKKYSLHQKLEVIDRRAPRLIRLATITSITPPHMMSLHFEGLDNSYDYDVWVGAQLYQVGEWNVDSCLVIDDVVDTGNKCPNHGVCKSVCSARGVNFKGHWKLKDCPFHGRNLEGSTGSNDRVVVFEDKFYDLGVVKDKEGSDEESGGSELELETGVDKERDEEKTAENEDTQDNDKESPSQQQQQPKPNPEPQPNNKLPKRSEILSWSHDQVSNLVESLCSNLPTAKVVGDRFRSNLIDGESFMMLTQSDMTDVLGIKLGPAVKIFNAVRLIGLNK